MADLTTIECAAPGEAFTLFESGPNLTLHLAGPGETGGTGPILCGFDRFAKDEDGHYAIGFSVGGGTSGPGVVHRVCGECQMLAGNRTISGSNAQKFTTPREQATS
jgi:hypothetical protein